MAPYQTRIEIDGLADSSVTAETHEEEEVSLSIDSWNGEASATISKAKVEQLVAFLQSWLARPRS